MSRDVCKTHRMKADDAAAADDDDDDDDDDDMLCYVMI